MKKDLSRGWNVIAGRFLANASNSLRCSGRLHQLSQVGFATTGQYALAYFIPQSHHRAEIRARWHHWRADFYSDSGAPGKPLVATQQGSRPSKGARQDGQIYLGLHLECT